MSKGIAAGLLASALVAMAALGIYKLAVFVGDLHAPEQRTYTCIDVAVLVQHDCVSSSDEPCDLFANVYNACIEELEAGHRVCVSNPGYPCQGYVEPPKEP